MQIPSFTDIQPAPDQKAGIFGSETLTVQFFQPGADIHGSDSRHRFARLVPERPVEFAEVSNCIVELPAKRIDVAGVLSFSSSYGRRLLGLPFLEIS